MFTHLHVHTEYSMLDGLAKLEPLVARAKELNMNALAITDHGGMYGAIDFYRLAKKSEIKPIIGAEMYVATGSRFDRNPSDKIHHLTVLSKNEIGYRNLVKLVTASNLEGYYKRPRVDRQILEKYSEGLVVLSGCPSGEVPWLIAQGREDEALETASWYKDVFGSYFLEIMNHAGIPELPDINKGLLELNKKTNIPIVGTNDSHYILQSHSVNHDVLLCIQTNTKVDDPNRMRFEDNTYHLKSHEEMVKLFSEIPQAITNTELIAEMCDLNLDFSQARLPEFPVPDGMTSDDYLAQICLEKFQELIHSPSETYKKRLEYELEVIKQTRFAEYFLVVWDIAKFVRKNDIFFTVRGSAAASLVLYCLGVTDVDPMPFSLVFERFLNIERKEMPDIDMDFQDDRRQEVINYCAQRYGREHVAHIITFGTFGARQSVRDAGRALGIPLANVDNVAKMIPEKLNIDLETSLKESDSLNDVYNSDNSVKKLIDTAKELEGVTRHKSLHAAGVFISKEPLDEVVPLEFTSRGDNQGAVMTQYAMDPIAALGLLKMDFLGLVNLTVLADSFKLIESNHGVKLTLDNIPLDDKSTFDLLGRGETVGVFQLESAGMTRHIKELKPNTINDIAAMIALFRPGPMDHIETFINAKHGRKEVTFIHSGLKDILQETYGVIVYQDQVLHIVREFAGYSLGEADIVRKAMGKKVPEIMAEEKDKFMKGALTKGYSNDLAEAVFTLIEPFAGYAFNKAHSVSYALVSYWTAYLKSNYQEEYMAAFMNSYIDKKDRLISAIADCRRMGIDVLPPNINKSDVRFSIENIDNKKSIRFGLAGIKNVGSEALKPMLNSRNAYGEFSSIEDFCKNSDFANLNKKAVESIIMAGGFDDFGDRGALFESSTKIISLGQNEQYLRNSNQTSMFDLLGDSSDSSLTAIELPLINTNDHQKRIWEVEMMGISLSSTNHLSNILSVLNEEIVVMVSQLDATQTSKNISVAGQVSTIIDRSTRDGRPFKIVTLEMLDGSLELVVWEDALGKTTSLWEPGRLLTITGLLRDRSGESTINVKTAKELNLKDMLDTNNTPNDEITNQVTRSTSEETTDKNTKSDLSTSNGTSKKKLILHIKESGNISEDQILIDDIKTALLNSLGNDDVGLEIETDSTLIIMDWQPVKVQVTQDLEDELNQILGNYGKVSVQSLMF